MNNLNAATLQPSAYMPGLEGVVAAQTRLSQVDGAATAAGARMLDGKTQTIQYGQCGGVDAWRQRRLYAAFIHATPR